MMQVEKELKNWKMRFLTPFGKVTILKTIIIPKFNHVFISIPNPEWGFIKKLNDIFYKFIWDNKPNKISRKQLANGYFEGGLKMPSILLFIKGLKVSWLRRLHQNSEIPWVELANHFLGDPSKILLFGSQWSLKISQDNQFWRDTLLAWNDTIKNIPGNMYGYEKWHGPLWYNTNIEKVINFLPQFYKNGILCPIDLITDKGQFMTKDQVTESYNLQVDFIALIHPIQWTIAKPVGADRPAKRQKKTSCVSTGWPVPVLCIRKVAHGIYFLSRQHDVIASFSFGARTVQMCFHHLQIF